MPASRRDARTRVQGPGPGADRRAQQRAEREIERRDRARALRPAPRGRRPDGGRDREGHPQGADEADQRRLVDEALAELISTISAGARDIGATRIADLLMEELAQVYARALFEVAREQGKLDELREQLAQFADALESDRQLAIFFFSPYFSTAEKEQGLERMLDGADDNFLNFLRLLIEKHRMPVIFRVRASTSGCGRGRTRCCRSRSPARSSSIRHDREPRHHDRRAHRPQGHPRRPRRPRDPRRHHRQGGQLDPRRLNPQPTGAAAQARCPGAS